MSIGASLGLSTMATANPGGGGGHFGGGAHFGGEHFGGAHLGTAQVGSANVGSAHLGTVNTGSAHSGGTAYQGDGHRGAFWNGYWPFDGGWVSLDPDYSTPDYSDTDSSVTAVQKALARAGYYHGAIDGALYLTTQDAIAQYDRDHHLPVTHVIDQSLLNALKVE